MKLVDEGRIALTPAVELSYLNSHEQNALYQIMACDELTPSLSQAQRLRKLSEDYRGLLFRLRSLDALLVGFDRISQVNKGNRFSRLDLCFQFVNGRGVVDDTVKVVVVLL